MSIVTIDTNLEYPRLRHCTFVEAENGEIVMIVGKEFFELTEEMGSKELFYEVKRYFDGRHSISEISKITNVSEEDIRGIVEVFNEVGLFRKEEPVHFIKKEDFVNKVQEACLMWNRQIGYHQLFRSLE